MSSSTVVSESLLVRGAASGVKVTPESAGWGHVGFEMLRLRAGQRIVRRTVGEEACVIMLAGRCRAEAAGQAWAEVGGRASPFDGPPHCMCRSERSMRWRHSAMVLSWRSAQDLSPRQPKLAPRA